MDHFINIYTHHADAYHQLIAPEDVDGNLLAALRAIVPLRGKRVLDLGTGTGRLPLLLAHETSHLIGLDLHWDMLREHAEQRARLGGQWGLVNGDMRALPCPTGWAEVVTAGWAIGHLVGWFGEAWPTHIGQVLDEMERVAASDATLLIMETLTTGALEPAPPHEGLARYYAWLENLHGFTRHVIATDYQFASVEEAVARTEFFFGAEMAEKIRANGWARLPEWTGVWSKSL